MDIIDIILAKKASTGAAAPLIKEAKEAVIAANEAVDTVNDIMEDVQSMSNTASQANVDAEAAINKANSAADTYDNLLAIVDESALAGFDELFEQKNEAINTHLGSVDEAISTANSSIEEMQETIIGMADSLDEKVSNVEFFNDNSEEVKVKKARVRKKNLEQAYEVAKNYTSTGNNEDGSMTQKAITEALNECTVNLDEKDSGKVVIIDSDGSIKAGDVSEEDLAKILINSGNYNAEEILGLEIDYKNKNFARLQEASGLIAGSSFDKYAMYGGRRRCVVNREGQIVAWYGDENYIEDGSLGQVMVYQPKFYYSRAITSAETMDNGEAIRKENLIISEKARAGFKVHPLFIDENGNEIDYVLLPAYESTFFDTSKNKIVTDDAADIDSSNDYLMSIAGIKPISGANKAFTIEVAEQMAKNIGSGWHITNMAAESANQMLETIEFGQLNMQEALEEGIVKLTSSTVVNGASITGSTSSLGNASGAAASTTGENDGTYVEYNQPGYRAISYRGFENPWGNIFRFVGGINIYGSGNGAGIPFIAKDYNYTPDVIGNNYENLGFNLTTSNSWISAFGYNKNGYEWVSLPIESQGASSLLPIGDFVWVENGFSGINAISIGGVQRQGDSCGPFYYACDLLYTKYSASQSARIMHIPTKDSEIYLANIASWKQQMGA